MNLFFRSEEEIKNYISQGGDEKMIKERLVYLKKRQEEIIPELKTKCEIYGIISAEIKDIEQALREI